MPRRRSLQIRGDGQVGGPPRKFLPLGLRGWQPYRRECGDWLRPERFCPARISRSRSAR